MPQPILEPPTTDDQYQDESDEIDTDDFGDSLIEDYVETVNDAPLVEEGQVEV